MAVSKIKVNTNKLKSTTNDIEAALKDIKNKIQAMENDVNELNTMWTGEAFDAFDKVFHDDIKDLGYICDNIQQLINYETKAKTEYDTCEKNVTQLVDSIPV